MFNFYNPNPKEKLVGDCVVRAITFVTNKVWETTYLNLCVEGLSMADMPSSNSVWGSYLHNNGFVREAIPNTCPDCYTVKDFCNDFKDGTFLLATGTHVIAVKDGNYYDAWDSGNEIPVYFWKKEN